MPLARRRPASSRRFFGGLASSRRGVGGAKPLTVDAGTQHFRVDLTASGDLPAGDYKVRLEASNRLQTLSLFKDYGLQTTDYRLQTTDYRLFLIRPTRATCGSSGSVAPRCALRPRSPRGRRTGCGRERGGLAGSSHPFAMASRQASKHAQAASGGGAGGSWLPSSSPGVDSRLRERGRAKTSGRRPERALMSLRQGGEGAPPPLPPRQRPRPSSLEEGACRQR